MSPEGGRGIESRVLPFERDPIPNDANTSDWVAGQFDTVTAIARLRDRQMAA
jgi:hypothetical protein